MIEKWYPTVELGDDKAILLLVTGSKEGALTGGPSAMKAFGDELIDSVVGDNIPILINEGALQGSLEGQAGGHEGMRHTRGHAAMLIETREECARCLEVHSILVVKQLIRLKACTWPPAQVSHHPTTSVQCHC